MLSPESAEEKERAWRLRVEREMLTLSDEEIDHGLGAIGGGGETESVEGCAFPDPKRRRLVEKLEIVVEDDEGMEEDGRKEEGQKMEEIGIDTDAEEKEITEFDLSEIAKSLLSAQEIDVIMSMRRDDIAKSDRSLLGCGLSHREMDLITSMRRHAMDINDEEEEEEEVEEVDEKVKEILDNVEKASSCVRTINVNHADLPNPNFFLLEPWESNIECPYTQIEARRLDSFYKRLVPIVKFKYYYPNRTFWSRLPEVDSQYVYLFTQLDESDLFRQKSLSFYVESHMSRRTDYLKALLIARSLNLDKLGEEDVDQCFMDLVVDRDRKANYELRTEYALFLLDCRYNQNLDLMNFTSKDHSPIMDRQHFDPYQQQLVFDKWMEKKFSGLQKEECKVAITDHYEKVRKEEDINYRIHFIRYKRDMAKQLRLIQ